MTPNAGEMNNEIAAQGLAKQHGNDDTRRYKKQASNKHREGVNAIGNPENAEQLLHSYNYTTVMEWATALAANIGFTRLHSNLKNSLYR